MATRIADEVVDAFAVQSTAEQVADKLAALYAGRREKRFEITRSQPHRSTDPDCRQLAAGDQGEWQTGARRSRGRLWLEDRLRPP
jgi:hypothetical protein